jgi:hypothetical protein
MRSRVIVSGWMVLLAGVGTSAAEPPARPPWEGNRVGVSDEVLSPWTPVAASNDRVSVWGRTYRFGVLPLPGGISAKDAEILTAPVTLEGVADGRPLTWSGTAARLVDARPARVKLATTAESDALRCEGEVVVEYDGMVRCDFRLVPKSGKARVERLALEIPLAAQHAAFLHTWPGQWGSAGNSAALPRDGYRGPFKPFVWLGDHERGFCWFAESDRNIFTREPGQVIEIKRSGDRVVLRVNLVTEAKVIDGPLDYTFGFQATPVKPPRPDAWDYRIVHDGDYALAAPALDRLAGLGVRTICFHEHWTDIQNYPRTTHGPELDRLVAACHQRKIQLLLYFGYLMSDLAPEWERYHEDCLVSPRAGEYKRQPSQTAYIVCYRSHWQDFLAQGIDRVMADHGVDGVYLDGTSEPWGCTNRRHGCGYVKPDGTVGTTYPIFATREMMKRIYTIVKRRNPAGQVNVHQSTCMTIPTLAFATSYWDGEQLQSLPRKASALKILPLDAFCAEFMGHNWGVPAELLWYGSGPFRRAEAMSMGLLHDIPVRSGSPADTEVASRLWTTFDAFGRHEATWLPYWGNDHFVRTSPAGVKASVYNRPGRGMIAVVVNTDDKPCAAEVAFDLAALGQALDLVAHDVLGQMPVSLVAGRLRVAIGPLEHRVVWLKPR